MTLYYIAPEGSDDQYAAGYDGNLFATREEAEDGIAELVQVSFPETAATDWRVVETTFDSQRLHPMIRSVATCCDSGVATETRCICEATCVVEWMPDYLRERHELAGNRGVYPHNGAKRLHVCQACADMLLDEDKNWTSLIHEVTQ